MQVQAVLPVPSMDMASCATVINTFWLAINNSASIIRVLLVVHIVHLALHVDDGAMGSAGWSNTMLRRGDDLFRDARIWLSVEALQPAGPFAKLCVLCPGEGLMMRGGPLAGLACSSTLASSLRS